MLWQKKPTTAKYSFKSRRIDPFSYEGVFAERQNMEHILHFPRRIIQRPGISKIRSSGQVNAILAVGLTKLKCFYSQLVVQL